MNICLITPGIDKKFNENYHAYKFISENQNNILAISNKKNTNKAGSLHIGKEYEIDGTLAIHRIFKSLKEQQSLTKRFFYKNKIEKILSEFKPDVIFCEEIGNFKFALELKQKFRVPIVLRTEFAFDRNHPYRSMGRFLKLFKNPLTGDLISTFIGKFIWKWAYLNSDAVISCYSEDASKKLTCNTPLYYVPWPTYYPKAELSKNFEKVNRGIFIGAFDDHKNLEEFSITIPKLIDNTPLKEFLFVGSGKNINIIEDLKRKYPSSVIHMNNLSRIKCLELIRQSFFSYSPAIRGGWGFIADSWATETPILVTSNHYSFFDKVDSIVTSVEDIENSVNSLYEDKKLYSKIKEGGQKRYLENHAAESVGKCFLEICLSVKKSHL